MHSRKFWRSPCGAAGRGWVGPAAGVLALLAVAPWTQPTQAQQSEPSPPAVERRISFNIPPQDLNGAILAFADKAGIQVFYDVSRVSGLTSHGVVGTLTPQEALGRILAGTDLSFHFTGANTVSLEKPASLNTGGGPLALPAVQVEGAHLLTASGDAALQDRIDNPEQTPSLDKTGTKLGDIPGTVHVIPHDILSEQGATNLRSAIADSSGVNQGGSDSEGFFDRFLIRGLDARIFSDGFSDGDQLNGIPHSLNGVDHVEILEGPGSALFGSGPPGGTINLVHYQPSPVLHYGSSLQFGSFGSVTNNDYVTGPTGIQGLDYRIDAMISHADGFRGLTSGDYEIRPEFTWHLDDHTIDFSIDVRHLRNTPDSYGLIYLNGSPIKDVSIDTKYSTPFGFAQQDIVRPTISDSWAVNDYLTINSRFSYLHRTLDILRNGDSGTVVGDMFTHRQLREQDDTDDDYDFQLEPVWRFGTGWVHHTLLTGFEFQRQTIFTDRATADLPNILNIFDPVIPETSTRGLTFLRDATHSGALDSLAASYISVYATDQIDVTERLKLRLGVRQDWWNTGLDPLAFVPGRLQPDGQPLEPGMTDNRRDNPVSWNIGALYKSSLGLSPYFGISKSYLANFNSENTQNGIAAPESAMQYEVGVKLALLHDSIVLNTAAFHVTRDNVAALLGDTPVFDAQKTDGLEASIDARVTAQWQILANVTAQHAVLTDNPSAVTAAGNRPQGVPSYIFNLWTTYDFSIAGIDGFQIGGGLNYEGKTFGNIQNTDSAPGYVILNGELSYDTPHWGASLNVRNLTNQRYFVAANGAGAFVGEPLGIFANVHMNF